MAEPKARSAAQTLAEFVPRLSRIIANALISSPEIALSLRQYRLLERLADRPHRTTELATRSDVTQPTASAAIAALESRGLVARTSDPSDRRATLIELTDAGRATFAAARAQVLAELTIVTSELTPADGKALAAMQPALVRGMDRLRGVQKQTSG